MARFVVGFFALYLVIAAFTVGVYAGRAVDPEPLTVVDPTSCLDVEAELAQCAREVDLETLAKACGMLGPDGTRVMCLLTNAHVMSHERVIDLWVMAEGREDVCE